VLAHAYTPAAIARAVRCGVRTIEHGNLIDDETARLVAEHGAYVVPTLVTYDALASEGEKYGLPPESIAKIEDVHGAGMQSIEIMKRAGVKMGFGTDLLGEAQRLQSDEFRLLAQVLSPAEVIASATVVGAEILGKQDKLGRIVPGAHADVLVVDGNPLKSVDCLLGQGEHIPLVMKDGRIFVNELERAV
jgi:imidazolonepropionase-like amidohydrolase